MHGHSGDDCIRAEKNHASEECGKCEKWSHLGNKPVTTWGSMLYFHEYLAMNMLFLHIFAMTKAHQKHQHESTSTSLLRWSFFLGLLHCFLRFVPFQRSLSTARYCSVLPPSLRHRRCCWAQPGVSWATKKIDETFHWITCWLIGILLMVYEEIPT